MFTRPQAAGTPQPEVGFVRARWRRAARVLAALGAALLLAGPAGVGVAGAGGPVRVLVVDRSGSMQGGVDRAAAAMQTRLLADGARVGVVALAATAWVEREPAAAPLGVAPAPSRRGAFATDVAR